MKGGVDCRVVGRIIGGSQLSEPVPYMVSMRDSSGKHRCGGTLIAANVVLTAAHCTRSQTYFKVDIGKLEREGSGKTEFETFGTTKIIVHPEYARDARYALFSVLDSCSHGVTCLMEFGSYSLKTINLTVV